MSNTVLSLGSGVLIEAGNTAQITARPQIPMEGHRIIMTERDIEGGPIIPDDARAAVLTDALISLVEMIAGRQEDVFNMLAKVKRLAEPFNPGAWRDASHFNMIDLRIGMRSVSSNIMSVPGILFSPDVRKENLMLVPIVCQVGLDITVAVTNLSDKPLGFSCCIVGPTMGL